MITQKILETYLNLDDPNHIYSIDITKTCIEILTKKFINKCYKSCYILKINKIIRSSNIYVTDSLDAKCIICVLFEADVIIYNESEIITGCKITKIEPHGRIYAESQYANIQMKQDHALSIYKEGYIIPVIARACRYYPNKEKISIAAFPFMPMFPENIIYSITDTSDLHQSHIEYLFASIDEENKKISKLTKNEMKAYDFFKKLLYPFKTEQKFESMPHIKTAQFKKIKFDTLTSVKSGLICYPIELPAIDQVFYTTEDPSKIQDILVVNDTLHNIIIKILNQYLLHLQAIYQLYTHYPDVKIISHYTEIWKMYNLLKR